MSTHCSIGKMEEDGSIKLVYCHSDGYLSWTGRILTTSYTDAAKVDELIALGDLSYLQENIGVKHDFNDFAFFRANKQVISYKRDRNETGTDARRFGSMVEIGNNDREDINYLFSGGTWHTFGLRRTPVVPLTLEDCTE